jgi:hypothetical protein
MGLGWECKMGFEFIERYRNYKQLMHLALLAMIPLPHTGLFASSSWPRQSAANQFKPNPKDPGIDDKMT